MATSGEVSRARINLRSSWSFGSGMFVMNLLPSGSRLRPAISCGRDAGVCGQFPRAGPGFRDLLVAPLFLMIEHQHGALHSA